MCQLVTKIKLARAIFMMKVVKMKITFYDKLVLRTPFLAAVTTGNLW